MKKHSVFQYFTLTVLLLLFFAPSCSTAGRGQDSGSNSIPQYDRDFSIVVINNSNYDISINNQRVPADSRGTVRLPAYENELTGGFDIMYEIPLSDSISLLCRGDNKKLRSDQKEVEIDKPVLTDGFGSYLVVVNRGKNSITLARGNARIPTLERQGNYLTSGGQYEFSPGVKAVYRIHPDNADQFEIEDGQKRTAVILPQTRDNYLYKVEYSPQSAVLFDARPLAMIGEPIYAAVEFRGRSLSDAEKNIFIQGLQRGIQNNNALVQITPPPPEVQIFHSFVITVNTMIRPPSPPANTELIQCDVSIAFARNGTTVQQSEQKRISELGSYTDRAFSLAANFIRDNGAFFQGVNEIAAQ